MASIYDTPADLNLINTYVPLPFEEMAGGLQAKQARYDQEADRITSTAEVLGSVEAAGTADKQYMKKLKDGYAREVVNEFEYGQVDLTDPNVTAKLRSKIQEYSNRPEFLEIATNAEVYPALKESLTNAMINQPNNRWNYTDALNTLSIFEAYGTEGVGSLTNVSIPPPSDVPGTLNNIVKGFKERGSITDDELSEIRTRTGESGVGLFRLRQLFNLDKTTGEAPNGPPQWFLNNDVGQELQRMTKFDLANDPDVTEENYVEKYKETLSDNYEATVNGYIDAYAYDNVETMAGLGDLAKAEYSHLRDIPITTVPAVSSRGLALDYGEYQTNGATSMIDTAIMNRLERGFNKANVSIDEEVLQRFESNLANTKGGINTVDPDEISRSLDRGRRDFVNEVGDEFEDAFLIPFTQIGKTLPLSGLLDSAAGDTAMKGVSKFYKKAWGNMINSYLESMYDAVVMTSPGFADVRAAMPGDDAEEANFTLITTAERYNAENPPVPFEELPAASKARIMNQEVFKHMAQLRQINVERAYRRGDSADYDEKLGSSIFGIKDSKEPLRFKAEEDGDAPGILKGSTAFTVDGNEFKFADKVKKDDIIALQGRLSPENPYGPGFFAASVGEETVFFRGSQAEVDDQYQAWHLMGYSRAYNGISNDVFTTKIGDDIYDVRTVEDKTTGQLRIDYKEPRSKSWRHYEGEHTDIIVMFEDLNNELQK